MWRISVAHAMQRQDKVFPNDHDSLQKALKKLAILLS